MNYQNEEELKRLEKRYHYWFNSGNSISVETVARPIPKLIKALRSERERMRLVALHIDEYIRLCGIAVNHCGVKHRIARNGWLTQRDILLKIKNLIVKKK